MTNHPNTTNTIVRSSGVLVVNKPKGITSHDVIDHIRKLTEVRRVGHAGTLDPLAEGVLIVLIGREATKKQSSFMAGEKEYIATIRLGATSDTDDAEGHIRTISNSCLPAGRSNFLISKEEIEGVLERFVGEIEQMPPAYSAVKVGGVKAYNAARKGTPLKLSARTITIKEIGILEYTYPLLRINVTCSKGTYIRSLARDVGDVLQIGAYLDGLIRTRSGKYTLADSVSLDNLNSKNITDYLVKIKEMP